MLDRVDKGLFGMAEKGKAYFDASELELVKRSKADILFTEAPNGQVPFPH